MSLLDALHAMDDGARIANDQILMTFLSICVFHERFHLGNSPGGEEKRLCFQSPRPVRTLQYVLGLGEATRRYNVVMSDGHDSLLYARVETVLAGEIADGDLRVGDQLPTEENLIARFGVTRITVRRAIQNLVSRGLVEIRRSKGTFVAAPKITQDLKELSGFVEDMHALGRKATARVMAKKLSLPTRPWPGSLLLQEASASSEFAACVWQTAFRFPSTRPTYPWRSASGSSPTI
jgi:DNA-binding transcriptional regulator YhcF (GntR family)